MRRFLTLLLFLSIIFSLPALAKRLTQGFRLAKLRLDFPYHPEWEIDPDPEVGEILKQNYRFIGKGAQSYVFESEDGNYVVKLFRYNQPPIEGKIVHLFNACKMAYDHLREETGLVYIHVNATPHNLPTLRCKDALGRNYYFPLDQTRFALQRKAKPFRTTLHEAAQDPAKMRARIDEFLTLLQTRAAKEILNADSNVSRNFGFLVDRAIEFDFGNYRYAPGLDREKEVFRYTKRLRRWLSKYAPEYVVYLDEQVKK